jgi:CheY-like chemotaxis protein
MCGIELAQKVAERYGLRTVLLSAFTDEETCNQALAAHAVTVLAKPLSLIDLERALEEAAG